MSVDKLTAINNVLSQMRELAKVASNGADPGVLGRVSSVGEPARFSAVLGDHLQQLAHMQNASAAQARAFQAGEPNVSLNDVMIDMQKSSIAFQTTVQARNRLVAAYQEIASMPL